MKRKTAVLIGAGMGAGAHISACAALTDKLKLKGVLARRSQNAHALISANQHLFDESLMAFDSIEQLAEDPDVDFAIVVTPPSVRIEVVTPLVSAGKHILLEKPVARNLSDAQELVAICESAGIVLGVVFQHRARAESKKAHALVQSGQLGALGVVEINVPWWRSQAYYDEPGRGTYSRDGGGVMITQAIHPLDLALSLTGPVKSVLAMSKTSALHTMESEDFVVAGLEFVNGAVGSMVLSTASFPGSSESITLHFEKASLILQAGQLTVTWRDGAVEQLGDIAASGGGADPMAFKNEWHQGIISDFADALGGKPAPIISGREALAVHELIEASTRSADSGSIQYLQA